MQFEVICDQCYEVMENRGNNFYVCPKCGNSFYWDDDQDDPYYDENDENDEEIPEGCQACGGPYPQCKSSCKLFDD